MAKYPAALAFPTGSPEESDAESQLLDRAYVVFERYQKREQLFAQLRSLRYRFMAAFESDDGKPFQDLSRAISEIFVAAQVLGSHYWPRQGRVQMGEEEFQKHLEEVHRREAVFGITTKDEDEISPRVKAAVEDMERITQEVASSQTGSILWCVPCDQSSN